MNAVEKDKQYIWGYIEFGFQDAVDEPTYLSALVLLHGTLQVSSGVRLLISSRTVTCATLLFRARIPAAGSRSEHWYLTNDVSIYQRSGFHGVSNTEACVYLRPRSTSHSLAVADQIMFRNAVTPKELLPAYGARAAWCLNNNYAAYWDDQSDVPMVEQDPPYPTTWVGSVSGMPYKFSTADAQLTP